MKIGDTTTSALHQLDRAHQKSGVHRAARAAADKLWHGLKGGGLFKEPKLKLRLLLSPSERPALRALAEEKKT